MQNQNSINITRINSIDFLRGLSILAVILLHINIRIPLDNSFIGHLLPPQVTKVLLWNGYYGVIIFFVISGFLITLASMKRWGNLQNIKYDQFYWIRFARIMPCLIALLFILSILDMARVKGFIIDTSHTSLGNAIFSALTFHINWLEAKSGYLPGGWDVLWSLSVEEAFYLFFPLICRWTKNNVNFIFVMLVFIVLAPFARTVFTNNEIWMDHSYLSYMDGIAFGCLTALLVSKVKIQKKYLHSCMLIGILLTLLIVVFKKSTYQIGLTTLSLNVTILEIGIAFLLIALYKNNTYGSHKSKNILCWFGRNSYEIYLTHMFFVIILTQIGEKIPTLFIPLLYFLIIAIAGMSGSLISNYYSEPINRMLRRKLFTKEKLVLIKNY